MEYLIVKERVGYTTPACNEIVKVLGLNVNPPTKKPPCGHFFGLSGGFSGCGWCGGGEATPG